MPPCPSSAPKRSRVGRIARHLVAGAEPQPPAAAPASATSHLGALALGAAAAVAGLRLRGRAAHRRAEAARAQRAKEADAEQEDGGDVIRTLDQLRGVLPGDFEMKTVETGLVNQDGTPDAPKVIDHLDTQMLQFIERSPFIQLGTADSNGLPFVSPKGDAPGFVVAQERAVLIPDRPGNNLAMGLQNMIANPQVGLLFEIPGSTHTLRVGGSVTLSKDPSL